MVRWRHDSGPCALGRVGRYLGQKSRELGDRERAQGEKGRSQGCLLQPLLGWLAGLGSGRQGWLGREALVVGSGWLGSDKPVLKWLWDIRVSKGP